MLLRVLQNVEKRIEANPRACHDGHTQDHSTCCGVHTDIDICPPQGERTEEKKQKVDSNEKILYFYLIVMMMVSMMK